MSPTADEIEVVLACVALSPTSAHGTSAFAASSTFRYSAWAAWVSPSRSSAWASAHGCAGVGAPAAATGDAASPVATRTTARSETDERKERPTTAPLRRHCPRQISAQFARDV